MMVSGLKQIIGSRAEGRRVTVQSVPRAWPDRKSRAALCRVCVKANAPRSGVERARALTQASTGLD